MDVKLVVVGGKNAGQKIAVPGPKFFIGRAEDCQLRPRSELISRHHCAILVDEGYVGIRDFGSKNGTYVNDERVRAERELKSGDHLRVGQLRFDVELAVEVGGKKKPKVHSVHEAAARTVESSSGSSTNDDMDVTSWLSDDDDQGMDDTQTIEKEEPDEAEKSVAETSARAASDTVQEDKDKEEEEATKVVGAWDKSKKQPDAASSRDAAADTLKNFFRRI